MCLLDQAAEPVETAEPMETAETNPADDTIHGATTSQSDMTNDDQSDTSHAAKRRRLDLPEANDKHSSNSSTFASFVPGMITNFVVGSSFGKTLVGYALKWVMFNSSPCYH